MFFQPPERYAMPIVKGNSAKQVRNSNKDEGIRSLINVRLS